MMKKRVISQVCSALLVLSTGVYAQAADKVVVIPMGGSTVTPGGWTDDGNEVRLTNSNDTVWIGANGTGKLHVEADPVPLGQGYSTTLYGVYGTAEIYGVVGEGLISDGVKGTAVTHGVTGYADTNVGVFGMAQDSGVSGLALNEKGVSGQAVTQYGVYGTAPIYGVYGDANYDGVRGHAAFSNGVSGYSDGSNGVYGYGATGYGGYFSSGTVDALYAGGNILIPTGYGLYTTNGVTSTLKAFTIDHPLEPETKVLRHFSTEGPEALVIYSGTTQLDASGEAVVQLPDYFDALTRDPRTQLTARNESMPGLFAGEVDGNSLFIGGGAPDGSVYWQVTAERDDPKARLERVARPVEDDKGGPGLPPEGSYISPEAYLE